VPLREESTIRIVVKFVVGTIGIESFRGAVELDFSPILEVDNEGIFLGGIKDNFVHCLVLLEGS
jgi:hypothetical protein